MSAADIVAHLANLFPNGNGRALSRGAKQLADTVIGILVDYEAGVVEIEEEVFLQGDEDWCEEMENGDGYESDGDPVEKKIRIGGEDVTIDQAERALAYYRSSAKETRTPTSMNRNFRFIKNKSHIDRLIDGENRGFENMTNRRVGFRLLGKALFDWTMAKIELGIPLHDTDLQSAALHLNDLNNYVRGFKASDSWVLRWKKSHRIRSRKVTKFVANLHWKRKDQIVKEGKDFVEEIKALVQVEGLPDCAVFNCDQSGCVKELYSNRTLSLQGEKKTERVVNCVSATTHSFTMMPVIFASGQLHPFLYVVLAEKDGTLPTRPAPYSADNLILSAGRSHIMTKNHLADFVERVVATLPPARLLMVADSWPAFKDHGFIEDHMPLGKSLLVRNLPPGTTGMYQPLDVHFFIFIKKFVKSIHLYVRLHDVPFPVHVRDNLLRIISCIFFQFCSSRFRDFLKYPWKKAGYLDRAPNSPHFDSPVDYCITLAHNFNCDENNCNSRAFGRCAYCEEYFCFEHFVMVNHRC